MISASSCGVLPTQVRWRQRPQGGFQQQPVDEFDGGVPVGAAGTVGDGDIVRVGGLQFPDGGPERLSSSRRTRREEFIGKGHGGGLGKIWMRFDKAWR